MQRFCQSLLEEILTVWVHLPGWLISSEYCSVLKHVEPLESVPYFDVLASRCSKLPSPLARIARCSTGVLLGSARKWACHGRNPIILMRSSWDSLGNSWAVLPGRKSVVLRTGATVREVFRAGERQPVVCLCIFKIVPCFKQTDFIASSISDARKERTWQRVRDRHRPGAFPAWCHICGLWVAQRKEDFLPPGQYTRVQAHFHRRSSGGSSSSLAACSALAATSSEPSELLFGWERCTKSPDRLSKSSHPSWSLISDWCDRC